MPRWPRANEAWDCQVSRKWVTELLGYERQLWSERLESILRRTSTGCFSLLAKPSLAEIMND